MAYQGEVNKIIKDEVNSIKGIDQAVKNFVIEVLNFEIERWGEAENSRAHFRDEYELILRKHLKRSGK